MIQHGWVGDPTQSNWCFLIAGKLGRITSSSCNGNLLLYPLKVCDNIFTSQRRHDRLIWSLNTFVSSSVLFHLRKLSVYREDVTFNILTVLAGGGCWKAVVVVLARSEVSC